MITNYAEMPVGAFQKIERIVDSGEDTNAQNLAILGVLTGKSEDELLDLPIGEFRSLMDGAEFLCTRPPVAKPKKAYKFGGWDCEVVAEMRKLTAGQYIDFQNYMHGEGDKYVEVLSCVLIPKGKTYNNGYDMLELQEGIRNDMCILDAEAVRAFFLSKWRQSVMRTLRSSKEMMLKRGRRMTEAQRAEMMRRIQEARDLATAGGGLQTLMPLQNLHTKLGLRASL